MAIEYRHDEFDLMYNDLKKAGFKILNLNGLPSNAIGAFNPILNCCLAIHYNPKWKIEPMGVDNEKGFRVLEEVVAERMSK